VTLRARAESLMKGEPPRGLFDRLLAGALWIGVPPYWAITTLRGALYTMRLLPIARVPAGCRVVSVGNITLGGSGKTPLVHELTQRAVQRGESVAIVQRGYGRRTSKGPLKVVGAETSRAERLALLAQPGWVEDVGDEAALAAMRCDGAAVWVSARRSRAVKKAAAEGARTIVLDDAFQHRAQARSENLVVWDGALQDDAHRLFPRGYYREPSSALKRATAIYVDERAEAPPVDRPIVRWSREIAGYWHAGDVRAAWFPDALEPLAELRGKRVALMAAIAHPDRVVWALRERGVHAEALPETLADHAWIDEAMMIRIAGAARRHGQSAIVTTEKDAVKLGRVPMPQDMPVLVLRQTVKL